MTGIKLLPLEASDREQFILDNQEALLNWQVDPFILQGCFTKHPPG